MSDRIRNVALLAKRFGVRKALELLALWSARQTVGFRQAIVYRLALDRIPQLAECDLFDWVYEEPDEGGEVRRFIGRSEGVLCYSSTVSMCGFSVPDRVRVAFEKASDAYVGDCVTEPEHRGKGIYPCALVKLAACLKRDGKMRLYLFVERDNLASIRSVSKAGFEPIGACSIWYFRGRPHRRWRFLMPAGEAEATDWKIELLPRASP